MGATTAPILIASTYSCYGASEPASRAVRIVDSQRAPPSRWRNPTRQRRDSLLEFVHGRIEDHRSSGARKRTLTRRRQIREPFGDIGAEYVGKVRVLRQLSGNKVVGAGSISQLAGQSTERVNESAIELLLIPSRRRKQISNRRGDRLWPEMPMHNLDDVPGRDLSPLGGFHNGG